MSVSVVKSGSGDYSIGSEIEGVFVSFASLSGARVAQLVQRGQDLQARAEAGDEQAKHVLGDAFKPPGKGKGKGAKAEEGDE